MTRKPQKGIALERATAFIQETLLKKDPRFSKANFTIETRKILTVKGVPYELDVLVTPTEQSMYLGKVVFECKDWARPVDKKEVVILADKVDVVGASLGILVARSITKGAEALLEQKPRLRYVQCSDDFQNPVQMEFVHTWHDFFPLNISFFERNVPLKDIPEMLDHEKITCILDGKRIEFAAYTDNVLKQILERDRQQNNLRYQTDSVHWRQEVFEIKYGMGEFAIDDRRIEKMQFGVTYWVEVRRQRIMSKFELEKQGRVYFFEPIVDSVTGDEHTIEIVQLL